MGRRSVLEKFLRNMRIKKVLPHIGEGKIVCDLGCGNGELLGRLGGIIEKGIGIDKRPSKNSVGENIELIKGDLTSGLPVEDGFCDVVTILAVIEHLEEPQKLIKEVFRILKDGGIAIITTPAPAAKRILEFMAFRLNIIDKCHIREHKKYFTRKDLARLLENSNLCIVSFDRFEFFMNSLAIARKPGK